MSTLQKISIEKLTDVMSLISQAIAEMEKEGIFQWDEIYPDEEKIKSDIGNNAMYGLMDGFVLCAIIVIDEEQSSLYSEIAWKYNEKKILVIHRLCVHPDYQRQGLARRLVLFAEQYAKENNYQSIRLDAFTGNPFAEKLYRKFDYEERGIISFRKGDFFCFEKKI